MMLLSLFFQQTGFAQGLEQLDLFKYLNRSSSLQVQDVFHPMQLRYFSFDLSKTKINFLIDKGDAKSVEDAELDDQAKDLYNYFLTGLRLPNKSFWVNLRPDSEDQVIDSKLARTDLGRVLLAADLQLKKDTAQLTSPSTPTGRQYWDKLYKKAGELFGSDNITIPTLTRPWIVPGEVIVRYDKNSVYVYKASLKVMLEQDYLKDSAIYKFDDPRLKELNEYSSQLIRDLVIPQLTKEINSAKRYSGLRQVFYSLVLAQWFKAHYASAKNTYTDKIDSSDLTGIASKEYWSTSYYFKEYQKSFKDGEYNIKEPVNGISGQSIRSYFSGGVQLGQAASGAGVLAVSATGGVLLPNPEGTILAINPDGSANVIDNPRGFDGLPNDDYTPGIKAVLDSREFAACNIEGDRFVQDTFIFESAGETARIGKSAQNFQLNASELQVLNDIIAELGLRQSLQDTTIVFMYGQSAHYSVGRNQIYLDINLLNEARIMELKERLLHEINERQAVIAGLKRMELYNELQRTALNPQIRSIKLRKAIEDLAKASHKMLRLSPAQVFTPEIKFGTSGWRWDEADYMIDGVFMEDAFLNDFYSAIEACVEQIKIQEQQNPGRAGVVIGGDSRSIGPYTNLDLSRMTAEFVSRFGIKVYLTDHYIPLPVVSLLISAKGAAASIVETASHNPGRGYQVARESDGAVLDINNDGLKFNPADSGPAGEEITGPVNAASNQTRQQRYGRRWWEDVLNQPAQGEIIDLKFDEAFTLYKEGIEEVVSFEAIMQGFKSGNIDYVVIDPKGGAGIEYYRALMHALGLAEGKDFEIINGEHDPSFTQLVNPETGERRPDRPEPDAKYCKHLIWRVQQLKAAGRKVVGLACDPDVDRNGIVDSSGEFLDPNMTLALESQYAIQQAFIEWLRYRHPEINADDIDPFINNFAVRERLEPIIREFVADENVALAKTIATTNMINAILDELWFGARLEETKVGFKWGRPLLRPGSDRPVLVFGEESQGLNFRSRKANPKYVVLEKDAMVAGLKMLEMVGNIGLTPMQLAVKLQDQIGYFAYKRGGVDLRSKTTKDKIDDLKKQLKAKLDALRARIESGVVNQIMGEAISVGIFVDGYKIVFADGSWLCIRFSGTEPVVRLYTEAKGEDAQAAEARRQQIEVIGESLLSSDTTDLGGDDETSPPPAPSAPGGGFEATPGVDRAAAAPGSSANTDAPNTTGGIDFRSINITGQPQLQGITLNMPPLAQLKRIDIDKEAQQLMSMMESGIMPSRQRVMEFISACYLSAKSQSAKENAISCLTGYFKLEEQKAIETPIELKAFLFVIEGNKV